MTRREIEEGLEKIFETYQKYDIGLYAIISKEDYRIIGSTGLLVHTIEEGNEYEICYRLSQKYWGSGLGTEAVKAVISYIQKEKKFFRLVSLIDPRNDKSIRVAIKAGAVFEKKILFHGKFFHVYLYS